ncbi:calponin [Hypoxylon texense]
MNGNTTGEPKKGIPCPHSDGKSTLACWDCAENGYAGRGGGVPSSPSSPSDFEKEAFVVLDDSPLEVRPPGEGIEVGALDPRELYPGLEAISGPVVIKDPRSWSGESQHKAAAPPTIFGFRRRIFWIILIGLLVVLLIGVAIGAAVGVSGNNITNDVGSVVGNITSDIISDIIRNGSIVNTIIVINTINVNIVNIINILGSKGGEQKSSTPTSPSSTPTPTPPPPTPTTATTTVLVTPPVSTPSPTPTSPKTTPPSPTTTIKTTPTSTAKATSTLTPAQSNGYCLGQDGSTYTDPGTGARFEVECDVAHQGKDIENLKADTMEDCVSLCAANSRCVGAIWYNVGPQGTDLNYCWLKSSLDDSDIRDTPDAQSVVRL